MYPTNNKLDNNPQVCDGVNKIDIYVSISKLDVWAWHVRRCSNSVIERTVNELPAKICMYQWTYRDVCAEIIIRHVCSCFVYALGWYWMVLA